MRTATLIVGWTLLSSVLYIPSSGAASAGDWAGPEGNYPLNWNYSAQSSITQANVASLQVNWTFPIPSAPAPYTGAEGAMVTPLVISGIMYTITNWHRVYALDARNGNIIWYRDLPLLSNYSAYMQRSVPGVLGVPLGHYHAILYSQSIRGRGLIWVITNTYQIIALDADIGRVVIDINAMGRNAATGVTGNHGLYDVDTPSLLVDDARGIVVFSPSTSEGAAAGRGYLEAWNVDGPVPVSIWQTFIIPPQDGSEPAWSYDSVENMTNAYIFNGTAAINLRDLPQTELRRVLYGDWGGFGFNGTTSFAGGSASWGGAWALDEKRGIAFVSTNSPGPDWNATYRPGPNLWSDAIVAVNVTSGKLIWGFQTMAHALSDYDCSWNVVLANATIDGLTQQVVYKGCKSGYIFALKAQTGGMLWYLKPPSVEYTNTRFLDPRNGTEMTRFNWFGYPSSKPIVESPSDTGSLESDLAFDPGAGILVAVPYNEPKIFTPSDVHPSLGRTYNLTQWEFAWGTKIFAILPRGPENTTVYGIDANNGMVKWSYEIPNEAYRGGVTVSGGVVYVSTLDGMLRMIDERDGRPIASRNIGGSLLIQPSLAEDTDGVVLLFLTDMGSSRWGPVFPGFIQALSPAQNGSGLQQSSGIIYFLAGAGLSTISILWVYLARRVKLARRSTLIKGLPGGRPARGIVHARRPFLRRGTRDSAKPAFPIHDDN